MNKQEILNEIKKTEEHLANMKNMLEECEYERWKPEKGEIFYFLNSYNIAISETWDASYSDAEHYNIYNCFKTREKAEQEAENILIRRQLEDIARRLNKGQKIDWNNHEFYKYSICFNFDKNEIDYLYSASQKEQGVVYCLSNEFYRVAIQEIGKKRLENYLRGE